jgi:hypothetical protein
MYPHSVVANNEITLVLSYLFIFDNIDRRGREVTGQDRVIR